MTAIEWTDETWNPTTGCDRVSPGCDNCYALTMAARLKGMGNPKYQHDGSPLTSGPGFGLTMHPDVLRLPFRWRKPRHAFVNSMSDLFHPAVPEWFIAQVFAVAAALPQHTFQILTKRHGRMRALLSRGTLGTEGFADMVENAMGRYTHATLDEWPLPNVHLGVSVEDQQRADLRLATLCETPASVRFVSAEPLLGPVNLDRYLWLTGASSAGPFHDYAGRRRFGGGIGGQAITSVPSGDLHWVIAGGESGAGYRFPHIEWVRSLRDQCVSANVPFFFKQWGGSTSKAGGRELDGRTWDEHPVARTWQGVSR